MRRKHVSLLALFIVTLAWCACNVNAGPTHPMTYSDFVDMVNSAKDFRGKERKSMSRRSLQKRFYNLLPSKVKTFMVKSTGGSIGEFGRKRESESRTCSQRPTLTMADVTDLAQRSFGIKNFKPSIPPCDNGGKVKKCKYDTGKCCQRPQVEFIGRYYDTAIAAMALGATRDEAFAPLIHARALAYTLEACDPLLNTREPSRLNSVQVSVIVDSGELKNANMWAHKLSLISLPPSYEVLYELYNTMLIERIMSTRRPKLPSRAKMNALRGQLFYKQIFARIVPLNIELSGDRAFPNPKDFSAVGLKMATSARILASRPLPGDESEAMLPMNLFINSTLRSSLSPISVFELQSKKTKTLNYDKCNFGLQHKTYFQYKIQHRVWNKYQACCAQECEFLAFWGGTFSAGSVNCCAGCNRFSCRANTAAIATLLAQTSVIEAPSKYNAGISELAMAV